MVRKKGPLPRKELVLQRERLAFDLRSQNCTQEEIAEKLEMSQQGISNLLARVQKKYEINNQAKIEAMKNDHLARHDKMRAELYEQWLATKDVAYLELIRKLDADDRKQTGADAPTKTETTTTVDIREQLNSRISTIFDGIVPSGPTETPANPEHTQ